MKKVLTLILVFLLVIPSVGFAKSDITTESVVSELDLVENDRYFEEDAKVNLLNDLLNLLNIKEKYETLDDFLNSYKTVDQKALKMDYLNIVNKENRLKQMDDGVSINSIRDLVANNHFVLLVDNEQIYIVHPGEDFITSSVGKFNWLETRTRETSLDLDNIKGFYYNLDDIKFFHPPLKNILNRHISSPYGYRTHPVNGTQDFHTGIDYPGPIGENVYATEDGVVTTSTLSGGYGNWIEINHGTTKTRYAHLFKRFVKKGDQVKAGDIIGELGSTGMSTGPHLHFEVFNNGERINPYNYSRVGR